jgi:hypothetical protein
MQNVTALLEEADHRVVQATGCASTPTLLFFHIGKTGGTSLTQYFQCLARTAYVQTEPDDYLRLETPNGKDFPDFVSGHYKVDPWLRRLPASWRTMVVIRDPIQHMLSSYWHIRTHPLESDNAGLCELIETTRQVDLGTLLQDRPGESFERHFDNPQTRFVLDKMSGPLDADDQARAIALLGSLTYVGTTERLASFAPRVAAQMAWANGWEEQVLPYAMVNPLNSLRTDEVPRRLLRHILAATEMDAELHQRAQSLQEEQRRPGGMTPIRTLRARADPSPGTRIIPVTDLIRVFPLTLQNVRLGYELWINGDEILLHPPEKIDNCAIVMMEDIPLDGHSEMAGRLTLAHESAAPVLFGIKLSQGVATLASVSFKVGVGQPLDIRLRFPPASGPARLELRTEMALSDSNAFAWATFTGLTMR